MCDEVMAGFERTGKLFTFEHFGIVGYRHVCEGAYILLHSLGAVAVSDPIADYFHENVYFGGLTYSHPLALRTQEAVIDVKTKRNCSTMRPAWGAHVTHMAEIKLVIRASNNPEPGLFRMIDLQRISTEPRWRHTTGRVKP